MRPEFVDEAVDAQPRLLFRPMRDLFELESEPLLREFRLGGGVLELLQLGSRRPQFLAEAALLFAQTAAFVNEDLDRLTEFGHRGGGQFRGFGRGFGDELHRAGRALLLRDRALSLLPRCLFGLRRPQEGVDPIAEEPCSVGSGAVTDAGFDEVFGGLGNLCAEFVAGGGVDDFVDFGGSVQCRRCRLRVAFGGGEAGFEFGGVVFCSLQASAGHADLSGDA